MKDSRVLVVGAGLSGLMAAWDLTHAGREVVIVDANARPGGVVGTIEREGYRFETSPIPLQVLHPEARPFCERLGLGDELVVGSEAGLTRHIYSRGRLHPVPKSLRELATSGLFTPAQKARLLMEPLVARRRDRREETVAEYFGRRFGRGVSMTLVDVLVSEMFAGNPNRIGVASAFPDLLALERKHRSLLRALMVQARQAGADDESLPMTFEHGLGRLVRGLTEGLSSPVRARRRVARVARVQAGGFEAVTIDADGAQETLTADEIVLAVPAPAAGVLLAPTAPEAADLLFEVEGASLVVVYMGFDAAAIPGLPSGFGMLAPRSTRLRTLGWICPSNVFPFMAPEGKVIVTAFLGGTLDPQASFASDEAVRHLVLGELALVLGQRMPPVPEVFGIVRWPEALPQYNVGHLRRVEAVRMLTRERAPGIALGGDWACGVLAHQCLQSGRDSARALLGAPVPE